MSTHSATVHNEILQSSLLDPSAAQSASPNTIYDSTDNVLDVNRTLTNCSGLSADQLASADSGACVNAEAGTAGGDGREAPVQGDGADDLRADG